MKILLALTLTFLPLTLRAHEATAEMAAAATSFIAALTPEQKTRVTFDFTNEERTNWHFVPRERKGLAFKDMTPEQRLLAHGLLSSGMSQRGYGKAMSIMSLETILADLEKAKQGGAVRDAERYFVTIFGTPGTMPWAGVSKGITSR